MTWYQYDWLIWKHDSQVRNALYFSILWHTEIRTVKFRISKYNLQREMLYEPSLIDPNNRWMNSSKTHAFGSGPCGHALRILLEAGLELQIVAASMKTYEDTNKFLHSLTGMNQESLKLVSSQDMSTRRKMILTQDFRNQDHWAITISKLTWTHWLQSPN